MRFMYREMVAAISPRVGLRCTLRTWRKIAAGLIALVLLVRHENRTPSPLIPLGLLRQPAIWHSDALAACHGAALVSLITFLPVYLQVVRGASPSETGFLLVPLTIGIGTGSLSSVFAAENLNGINISTMSG
jgi:predicted MFS family arabinose efflux permease